MNIHNLAWFFLILITETNGDGCDTIDGSWVNQLGSQMDLTHDKEGTLTGVYITKVESVNGSAGPGMRSNIVGVAEYDTPGATFGFSVLWRDGWSSTVWTGQCHLCEGEAVLMTSWLLRSRIEECGDRWKAIRVGQDYFTRKKTSNMDSGDAASRNTRDVNENLGGDPECDVLGTWYNAIGSRLEAAELGRGVLKGDYWTAQEVLSGELSDSHSRVHGHYNPDEQHHTMAFFVSWNKGESVTGWVGQCHLCEKKNSTQKEAILETSWLHRVAVTSCHANWKSTLYGQTSFRRPVQRALSPDDDVIGEFGEDVGLCPLKSAVTSGSTRAATYRVVSILTGLAVMYVVLRDGN